MKQYNTYKPSGIEWLGDIPEHWKPFRFIDYVYLKHGFQFRDFDFTDEGLKVIKITQLNQDGSLDLENCSFIDTSRLIEFNSLKIKEGDILMALTGGTIGKIIRVNKVNEPLLQNYRVGNFFPNKKFINKTFLFHMLSSQITFEQINYLLNRNGQPNIGKESFKNMFFPLPNLSEQTAIANYLDTKTAAIDRKIELLTAKADKYKALRRSLINETVCRGLPASEGFTPSETLIKMKDSGIEWIGMIPEHWMVKRVKELFDISRGRVIGQEELIDDGKYPVYSSQTENNGCLGYINTYGFNATLLTWTTDGANAGTVFKRTGKFNCTNVCGLLKSKRQNHNLDFMLYVLQISASHNKRIDTNGAKIMSNEMSVIPLLYPPIEEQTAIATYLDSKTTQIDTILTNISNQINKLTQLRKTLINDVVTGKIKVTD